MQRSEDPGGDLARRVRHGVNAFEDPFQRSSVAGGEIHELPADGLRIEDGVKGQRKGSRSQTLLKHSEPHIDHLLAPQGRVLTEGRILPSEPDRNWTAQIPGRPVSQIILQDPTSRGPQFASSFVRNFPTIWLDLFNVVFTLTADPRRRVI
jgi:hypothetical protein